MKYLTGYAKTNGHVVLEKADVKGINIALAVCGDLDPAEDDDSLRVIGRTKGALASFFQNEFTAGIMKYGEDYLSAASFAYSIAPAAETPIIGPGCSFGKGCAGILAAGSKAYIWVTKRSGMCIVRLARVFGKSRFVRCISSYEGGEDVLELVPGSVIIACPECWTAESEAENTGRMGRCINASSPAENIAVSVLSDEHIPLFDPDEIASDEVFDRRLSELKGEGFEGCIAALLVK